MRALLLGFLTFALSACATTHRGDPPVSILIDLDPASTDRTVIVESITADRSGMALATILAQADTSAVPASLLAYERLRRERVAQVQLGARQNGLRLDSAAADLSVRDAQLAAHAEFRKHLYSYDVVPDARTAAAALQQ